MERLRERQAERRKKNKAGSGKDVIAAYFCLDDSCLPMYDLSSSSTFLVLHLYLEDCEQVLRWERGERGIVDWTGPRPGRKMLFFGNSNRWMDGWKYSQNILITSHHIIITTVLDGYL
ncbi:hypothetical protein ACMFMF_007636 [Clarireedia jacksonii]